MRVNQTGIGDNGLSASRNLLRYFDGHVLTHASPYWTTNPTGYSVTRQRAGVFPTSAARRNPRSESENVGGCHTRKVVRNVLG